MELVTACCLSLMSRISVRYLLSETLTAPSSISSRSITKTTWRKPSEYSYIEMGLKDLKDKILEYHIESIAIPPLGSHNGGLDWNIVKQMIISQLSDLNCEIILYEPNEAIIDDEI